MSSAHLCTSLRCSRFQALNTTWCSWFPFSYLQGKNKHWSINLNFPQYINSWYMNLNCGSGHHNYRIGAAASIYHCIINFCLKSASAYDFVCKIIYFCSGMPGVSRMTPSFSSCWWENRYVPLGFRNALPDCRQKKKRKEWNYWQGSALSLFPSLPLPPPPFLASLSSISL